MSRVEDDRQAQKAAERLVQEKRLQEAKAKQAQGETAFSKLVQQQKAAPPPPSAPKTPQQSLGKSVLARMQQEGKSGDMRGMERQQGAPEGALTQQKQGADQKATTSRAESRQVDAKQTDETQDSRTEEFDKNSDNSALGAVSGRSKGALKTDADGGGKGSGGDKDKKDGELAAGFRYNPALRAPVPVAQPKSTAGSERLRAIAAEIAQKIVERVRVGTNAAGASEFQIDLRGDVLSGLSIKVSSKNGKISAVFSGKDRDVLKMLEEQKDGLKSALAGRGLTLEDLKVEAKS